MTAEDLPPVLLVVGPRDSGKTSLVQCLEGVCNSAPAATIGLEAGVCYHLDSEQEMLSQRLREFLPPQGLDFEVMEIGGKEETHREMPRGRRVLGLLVCYDSSSRESFQRGCHVLCRHRMDRHMELSGLGVAGKEPLACVFCPTKSDLAEGEAVSKTELEDFAAANSVRLSQPTSAQSGRGVRAAFATLVEAILEVGVDLQGERAKLATAGARPAAQNWSLPCDLRRTLDAAHMTSPRGFRPHEPARRIGGSADFRGCDDDNSGKVPLIEALDSKGQPCCEPRSLAQCLGSGLLHRAVHLWICVPRSGALLLRKWSRSAAKHPGRWGPTSHSELHSYGHGGDGHAAEVSSQAAERSLSDQLGLDISTVRSVQHVFSSRILEGNCKELVDVYLAPVGSNGVPPLKLASDEEVEWVFYRDILSTDAVHSKAIFNCPDDYRIALDRQMRSSAVREDVKHAFGADLMKAFSPHLLGSQSFA